MKWFIPAKTFFLGEYAAIAGGPAIVLTTTPCFELTLTDEPGLQGIHPDSPAGRLWVHRKHATHGLLWHDPYQGQGGLGASSAQCLGAWMASNHLQKIQGSQEALLDAYFQFAWQGVGARPSGYDILAQSLHGCVYIHRQSARCQTFTWPFSDLAFILLHTGQKLATHEHLQTLTMTGEIAHLTAIVESAKLAFETADSDRVIDAVNAYHQCLLKLHLVASHSMQQIALLKKDQDVLAIKGCGAMGADVLLLLVEKSKIKGHCDSFLARGLNILATSENLLIENT